MGLTQSSPENSDANLLRAKKLTNIKFYLQDSGHTVQTKDIDPGISLNFYLRNVLHMTGTKAMCLEGGCGACVVVLQNKDPITEKDVFLAVNSCLTLILSCNGWRIFTIEGIGNPLDDYHLIQKTLAAFNGTQCGFCSPGMVMNMYALYKSGELTMKQVEDSFSGNLCRCTGYRPILTAFKSLCKDASPEMLGTCPDIEDLKVCPKEKCVEKCDKQCEKSTKEPFYLEFEDSKWIKVHTLQDLLLTLAHYATSSYRLVAGNTAQGVYKSYQDPVDIYIDVTDIPELKVHEVDNQSCVLGANTTLTDTIEFFNQVAQTRFNYHYLKQMADHINLVANVPVRNRGTIAGNLMIKHDHHEFPSDIFLILETVGAELTIVNFDGDETKLSPLKFITYDMSQSVLKTITLTPYPDSCKYVSYKIMPRAQNTHAHVNSGFFFKFGKDDSLQAATIVFGNINPTFVHAKKSEQLLKNKNLFDNSVLGQVYDSLASELAPDVIPPDPSPIFRKQLAIALFYKAVLSIAPSDKLSPAMKSGGTLLDRPVSTGVQDYETNKSLYPLTQAITKLEALAQTSGQAQYVEDLPDLPSQLFGALVLAEAPPNSTIQKIDPSKALKCDDIVAFYSKDDIPGNNSFTPIMPMINTEEEIFCSGRVLYYEQPIGILVGKNQDSVTDAVKLVDVTYSSPNVAPLLNVRQVLKAGRNDRITQYKTIQATRKGNDVKKVIKGTFDIYHQYHFHMETQCCSVVPNENGLDVYPSSQWMDLIQVGIAKMLNIQTSRVNVTIRRCGGGFGGKITRNGLVSCAAALAAWKLKQPVKLRLPLTTNMVALGKRYPLSSDYEVGVDDKGVIQYLNCSNYTDVGAMYDEDMSFWLWKMFLSLYTSDTFTLDFNRVVTDTHTNTWCRGPGSVEGLAAIESIMEHVSHETKIDALELRRRNLTNETPIGNYFDDISSWAGVDARKQDIAAFNKQNRWKKRGLAVVPMSFDLQLQGPHLTTVSIFQGDGSVQISHGGIEIGQGINTKAAQVCAYMLKIPLEKVTVLPSNSFVSPNNTPTGGSIASDGVCYGVQKACEELLSRIKPYQADGLSWEDVIKKCHEQNVKLVATGVYAPKTDDVKPYSIYGICAAEVMVDILTGQHLVTRVDLIQDTGISLSPFIDIGQVEGALVMGLGYYTMERIVFNYEGKILTNNTWTYYPPGAKDIPIDFRVKLPKNNPNPLGVLKSKGTGEPAFCLGVSVPFAIRNALASARVDAKESNPTWFPMDGPTDVENVFLNSLNDYSQYVL
jgi:xanthine dehydrogenase/oxidase